MGKIKKIFLTSFLAISIAFIFACYVPDDFSGDVTIDNNGNFILDYSGILTWTPYYAQMKQGTLSGKDLQNKISSIKADLARDSNFSEIESIGNAQFKVKYHREGLIKPNSLISFVRRDSLIMKISTDKNGITTFAGRWLTPQKAKQLEEAGLKVQGVFRVKTNAEVISNNANKVTNLNDGFKLFYWNVDGLSNPPPSLVLRLNF